MAPTLNRIPTLAAARRGLVLRFETPYFDVDVKEGLLASSIERYAFQSIADRIEKLEAQVSQIQETQEQIQKQQAELERKAIRIKSQISGAMDVVAAFSKQNLSQISDVVFGWSDNEYRFIVVSNSQNFNWDLCDKITDIESILLEDYQEIPVSCKCIPLSANEDVEALLEHKFCSIILKNL